MPRQNLILQSTYPYSLTARANNKEWFDVPLAQAWRIFEEQIAVVAERYGVQTHCFVLMSNHFHWLVTTPQANLGEVMRYFMTETSRALARASGRINKIYGARYKSCLLVDDGYYANTIRYFYQNPLRAKICRDVDGYPWTTRSAISRIKLSPCKLLEGRIPTAPGEMKEWLNKIPPGPYQLMMQTALRKSTFEFPRHPTSRRKMESRSFLD